jgi:hypothetical protein
MNLTDYFDSYALQARLQPALLVLFPATLLIAVWVPRLYSLGTGLLGLAGTCGATVLMAHFARENGRRAEKRLYGLWGGKPTTLWLRRGDQNLDRLTKERYYTFLTDNVSGWNAPTEVQEQADPVSADMLYESAARWLLERTRDKEKYPLVFKELVSYGFRRNLYGIKAYGLAFLIACVVIQSSLLYMFWGSPDRPVIAGIILLIADIVAVLVWTLVINSHWVHDSADAYARALLSSCDQ